MRQFARSSAPVLHLADCGEVTIGGFCIFSAYGGCSQKVERLNLLRRDPAPKVAQSMRGSTIK